MTTTRDVRLAVQPLVQGRKDLVSIGRFVFIKPIHHILKGVYIDSSRNPDAFVPSVSIDLLVPAHTHVHPGWGARFIQSFQDSPVKESGWDRTKPDTVAYMLRSIEETLSLLDSIQTFDEYFSFVSNLKMPWIVSTYIEFLEMLLPIIKGDLELPRKILGGNERMRAHVDRISPDFYPALVAGDCIELARILHDWETTSVKTYKIQKFWERTPFPLEMHGT